MIEPQDVHIRALIISVLWETLRGQLTEFGLMTPQGVWRIPKLQALATTLPGFVRK